MPSKISVHHSLPPWRKSAFLTMQNAATVTAFLSASLYRFAAEGRLELRRLGGRTLVVTAEH